MHMVDVTQITCAEREERGTDYWRTHHPSNVLPPEHTLPREYVDAWDRRHVRLPCSPRCVDGSGAPVWTAICRALHPPPASPVKLVGALHSIRRALGGSYFACEL